MIGKTDFPDVLPPPPSPPTVKALLGHPHLSSDNFDTVSNISIDANDFNELSNNCIKISRQSTVLSAGHQIYSPSSSCSSVSVTHSELLSTGEYSMCLTSKDCQDLYPLIEFQDGKEVITLTTSNVVSNKNTLSTSMPGFNLVSSIPTSVGKSISSRSKNHKTNIDPVKAKSDIDVSAAVENDLSHLLMPDIFASAPSCSNSGASSTEFEASSELPLNTPVYSQDEEIQRKPFVVKQSNLVTTCSQKVQMNCNSSKYKDGYSGSDILLTPDRLNSAYRNAEIKNENRLCNSRCLCRLCIPSTLEADLMTSDFEDDIEQDLKDIEKMEEEDSRKEERQTHCQTASSYGSCRLPPIGVFWDIENCQVPKGLSATHVVQAIRARYFNEHREVEFMCVCDTLKENSKILEELNDAQVNVMHVGSTVKNAADDKLLQSMRRFADIHGPGATIVLISGDSNFATELYDLRYRKNLRVIIVHNAHAQDSLKLCAHETALFSEVTQELPQRSKLKGISLRRDISIRNLPDGIEESAIRRRLNILSANCGGKVGRVRANCATVYFQTPDLATRAKKRLDGEDVFGNKIYCSFGKSLEKEGSPKINSGKFLQQHFSRDRETEIPECGNTSGLHVVQSPSQPVMGEMGAVSLPWRIRDTLNDGPPLHQPYSAFKSYGKIPPAPVASEQQYNSQRMWKNSGCKSQSQSSVGVNGGFSGISQDYSLHSAGESASNCTAAQPLYLDKTPEKFKKGRSQKVHFRMSSPPSFSLGTRISESYALDNTLSRLRSPSPLLAWSGISPMKHTWSLPATTDLQGQVLCGLRELSLGEETTVETSLGSASQVPVELQVTNLDQNIDAREMKRILFTIFRDHVMVLHVSVFVQSDGNLAATLRVPSQQDAQYAISQLHRKKIGAKRIIISYVNHNQPSPELKRSKVIALLHEVPGKKLPLFKFRELYEKRFHETIGVSEMYNMRDIVTVSDNSTGRMVSLHPEFRHIHTPVITESAEEADGNVSRYCKAHSLGPDESVGWAERDQSASLPNVNMTLRALAASIHSLLQSHSGYLPLASLVECYQAEIGPLEECDEGVPLEHLVSCLPGVCILTAAVGFKYIQWVENTVTDEAEELARCVSPPLVGQLALFSRELVDLLKTFPHCRLPFSRFIPAYHHHFGRQCRVADYGFTKLADLFDALPHIIQVLGDGNKRILTLAHKSQIKRFSSDLLRVLKGQPTKAITLEVFPSAYEKALTRPWNVIDYGVCDVEDLLTEVSETTVIVTRSGTETTIAIPKREQTPEEIERTRQFAAEVVELLRHSPQCKMQFNRFIPAYHHHFGRQCRVADYGFSKLIELFEAIPDILQLIETGDEPIVTLVDRGYVHEVMLNSRQLLWDEPSCCLPLDKFVQSYTDCYNHPPNLEVIRRDLEEVLTIEGEVDDSKICLVALQIFARDLLTLLHEAGGRMLLLNFDTAYLDRFGVACRPAAYGFPNIVALVQALGDLVAVRGRGTKRILVLNRDTAPSPPFFNINNNSTNLYSENLEEPENEVCQPPPASQLPPPNKIPSPPHCDYQRFLQDTNSNSHLVMSMNPGTPQQPYQSSPPVIYPGSPAPTGGSVMWGQMWSPQYPVMPPLSPAHYMVPTIPMSWGNVAASPLAVNSTSPPAPLLNTMVPPISIHTLDELSKQGGKENADYTSPPNASELPSPELFTQMPPETPASAPASDDLPQTNLPTCGEDEGDDTWSSCTSDSSKVDASNTSTVSAPKLRTKRRIAAQFTAS